MATELIEIVFRAAVATGAIILFTRLNGLRTFSKLSSFDFAITVAFGSVIASAVISPGEPLDYGLAALAGLFAAQRIVAAIRTRMPGANRILDNTPVLVMEGETIYDEKLARCRMSRMDLYAKLREANAIDFSRVIAVVVETTGSVSVMHREGGDVADPLLLEDVRR